MIHADWGWLALVGGAILLPEPRRRRIAAGGLGAMVLALGALRASGGAAPMPGDFAAVETALVLLGLAALATAALPGVRQGWRGAVGLALTAVGVVLLGGDLRSLAGAAPVAGVAAAFGVVVGTAGLAVVAAGRIRRLRPTGTGPDEPVGAGVLALAGAGTLLAGLGPHLLLVFAGVLLAAIGVWAGAARPRPVTGGLPPVLAAAALGPAYWLVSTIAGGQRLAMAALTELPLSPAAESLLAPLVLLAAWAVGGLWPLPRSRLAGLAGLAGLFLVARVGVGVLPQGFDHWRPLAYPILGVGIWQGAGARRWPAVMIGGALLALLAGSAESVAAASWLGLGALAAEGEERFARRELVRVRCGAALCAGYGVLPAVVAGLRVEVVYTTLIAAGTAVLLAVGSAPRPASDAATSQPR